MIRQYFEEHKREIVDTLKALASIPSVRSAARENAPYGAECARALEFTRDLYEENGFAAELHADKGYLLARAPGAGEGSIGLFAHADVVPPGDGWMYCPPFAPMEKDGFLIGRGVDDNKAGIVTSLFAARAIRDLGLPMRRSIVMFTGSNEESGMGDITAYRQEQPLPDVSLVPDCAFPVYRGEKGILRFWADAPAAEGALTDAEGGAAFNIVLDKAAASLADVPGLYEALTDAAAEGVTVKRAEGRIELEARGVPRHAAMPEGSVNAGYLLAKTLAGCGVLEEAQRKVMAQAAELLSDPYGVGFGIAAEDAAFGPLTCVNGMMTYAGHAALSFDVRYGTSVDGADLEKRIVRRLEDMGWSMRMENNRPGFLVPEDSPLVQGILRVYERCTGETGCVSRLSAGGTYARYLPNAVSIGTSFAHPRPFELPEGHGDVHQADECISIEGLLDAMAVVTEMILFCDTL